MPSAPEAHLRRQLGHGVGAAGRLGDAIAVDVDPLGAERQHELGVGGVRRLAGGGHEVEVAAVALGVVADLPGAAVGVGVLGNSIRPSALNRDLRE